MVGEMRKNMRKGRVRLLQMKIMEVGVCSLSLQLIRDTEARKFRADCGNSKESSLSKGWAVTHTELHGPLAQQNILQKSRVSWTNIVGNSAY